MSEFMENRNSKDMVIHVKIHDRPRSNGRGKDESTFNKTWLNDPKERRRRNLDRTEKTSPKAYSENRDQSPSSRGRERVKSKSRSIRDRSPPHGHREQTQSLSRKPPTRRGGRSRSSARYDSSKTMVLSSSNTHARQDSLERSAPLPPPKKTEYIPLNSEVLEGDQPSVTPSETGPSSLSQNMKDTSSSANDRQSASPDFFPSIKQSRPPSPISEPPLQSLRRSSSSTRPAQDENLTSVQLCARPASPSISSYATYSSRYADKTNAPSKDAAAAYMVIPRASPATQSDDKAPESILLSSRYTAQKTPEGPRVSRRTLSPAPRKRCEEDKPSNIQSTSVRASRTWLVPRHNDNEDKAGTQSKSERGARTWGLSILKKKPKARDEIFVRDNREHRGPVMGKKSMKETAVTIAPTPAGNNFGVIDSDDLAASGKQVQFLSMAVNTVGSYESNRGGDENVGDKDLSEIIKTTELLERKLEGVGDLAKPQMTLSEIGELIAALSKLRAHAIHLQGKRSVTEQQTLQSVPQAEGVSWIDSLTRAMLATCEWKYNNSGECRANESPNCESYPTLFHS